jgi:hypothetical protein
VSPDDAPEGAPEGAPEDTPEDTPEDIGDPDEIPEPAGKAGAAGAAGARPQGPLQHGIPLAIHIAPVGKHGGGGGLHTPPLQFSPEQHGTLMQDAPGMPHMGGPLSTVLQQGRPQLSRQLVVLQEPFGVQHVPPTRQTSLPAHAQVIDPPHPSLKVPPHRFPQVAGVQPLQVVPLHTCGAGQLLAGQLSIPPQLSGIVTLHLPAQVAGVQQLLLLVQT